MALNTKSLIKKLEVFEKLVSYDKREFLKSLAQDTDFSQMTKGYQAALDYINQTKVLFSA